MQCHKPDPDSHGFISTRIHINTRREFSDSEIIAIRPEEFREFLAAERERWTKLVKETGIKVQ